MSTAGTKQARRLGRSGRRQGGTLLEVLVSLVILSWITASLVDVMSQQRRAQADAQAAQAGLAAALRWQMARATGVSWAQGEAGVEAPPAGGEEVHWELSPLEASAPSAAGRPDGAWRQLRIWGAGAEERSVRWQGVIRLGPHGSPPPAPRADPSGAGRTGIEEGR